MSREIYGNFAALLYLFLWCFSPSIQGWGATICPDAVAAAIGIVAIYFFRRWLRAPNWKHATSAGIWLGLMPLAKLTWIIAFGIWPLVWLLWTASFLSAKSKTEYIKAAPFSQLLGVVFIALYTLNMGYLFDGSLRPLGEYDFSSRLFSGKEPINGDDEPVSGNRVAATWLGAIPVPLPADFVQGMDTQRQDFERGLPSYLRGEWAGRGWWYYYLYALAIKEPLGIWCLVFLAVIVSICDKDYSRWRDEMLVLIPCLVLLIFVSSQSGFSVHSRYAISTLPLVYVWTSQVARAFESGSPDWRRLLVVSVTVLSMIWIAGSVLMIYPHSLSYFNELAVLVPTTADAPHPKPVNDNDSPCSILSTIASAGPRYGPRHLLGSNIDWGQDLYYLTDWLDAHPEVGTIRVAYSGIYPIEGSKLKSAGYPPAGSVDADRIDEVSDKNEGPQPGWYAVSVNEIYSPSRRYRYFLHFRPVALAGYSIYIYHITQEDLDQFRNKPGTASID